MIHLEHSHSSLSFLLRTGKKKIVSPRSAKKLTSGVGNVPKDPAGTTTLTPAPGPQAPLTHTAVWKTEETRNPPQVVLVGVEHTEAPPLQA